MVPVMTLLKVKVIQKASVYEEKLHILIRFPEPSSHDLAKIDLWLQLHGKTQAHHLVDYERVIKDINSLTRNTKHDFIRTFSVFSSISRYYAIRQ